MATISQGGVVREFRFGKVRVALSHDAHLSDNETVAKMGHPDVGHPPFGPWVGGGA